MRKILLLENKDYRQKKLAINFKTFDFIDNILGDKACNILLDEFLKDQSKFDIYDTIIIHESIYYNLKREKLFDTLDKFCLDKGLIKFSGNNTQFSLENELSLQLNPTTLYENLEIFLETYKVDDPNILMLALGKNWYLNVLLNSLEKLNIFIENNNKPKQKSIFSSKTGLTKIKAVSPESYALIFSGIESNTITTDQMKKVAEKLKNLIQDKANE